MTQQHEQWIRAVYDAMCAYDRGSGLRIHHFVKMHSFARQIGWHEGLDEDTQFTLEVAALTHDIGIKKCLEQTGACPGNLQERLGPPETEPMLRSLGLPESVIERVCFLIGHHHTTAGVDAIDWRIILEADYLVNMIEGKHTPEAIDTFKKNVFRTEEGLRLLELIRPAADTNA